MTQLLMRSIGQMYWGVSDLPIGGIFNVSAAPSGSGGLHALLARNITASGGPLGRRLFQSSPLAGDDCTVDAVSACSAACLPIDMSVAAD